MSKVLAFIQNLSLDITAGAVISSLFVCDYFGVNGSFEMMLGLGIAIWLIYTIDHLRDAGRSGAGSVNPRHAFHRKHRLAILLSAFILFGVGVMNAFQLPISTVKSGLVLGGLSGLYFAYLKFSSGQRLKEFFAAVIYTAGIFAGPISLITSWEWSYLVVFFLFLLLVAANLVLFPLFEMDIDSKDKVMSIALKAGKKKASRLVWLLLALHFLLLVVSVFGFQEFVHLKYTFLAMNLVLVLLLSRQEYFRKYLLYRWLGDGIFFIPLVALI